MAQDLDATTHCFPMENAFFEFQDSHYDVKVKVGNDQEMMQSETCADPVNFLRVGEGEGRGVQIPRRGLTENFIMAKINNLAIPGGGGVRSPCPPSGSAHEKGIPTPKTDVGKTKPTIEYLH